MRKLCKVLVNLCLVMLLATAAMPAPNTDGNGIAVCWTNCPGPGFDR